MELAVQGPSLIEDEAIDLDWKWFANPLAEAGYPVLSVCPGHAHTMNSTLRAKLHPSIRRLTLSRYADPEEVAAEIAKML